MASPRIEGNNPAYHQMKILCLLANTWHPDPTALHQLLSRQPDRRHEAIARHLFYTKNLTGSRILTVFGQHFKAHHAIFEHASTTSPAIGDSGGRPAYNVEHVRQVINRHRPDVILAVGVGPQDAIKDMRAAKKAASPLPPVIDCIQPSTTRPGWLKRMTAARDELDAALNRQEVCA